MTNRDFVNSITSLQDKGMEQAWVKRALEAFPNAESLRNIEGPWDREVPDIRDDELTPASEIQSGASSASPSSDASIVVSGSRSQSHRHKRHKSSHEGRHKTRSASRSADSSSRPSSSRPTTSPSAHLSSAISSSTSTPPASGPSTLANRSYLPLHHLPHRPWQIANPGAPSNLHKFDQPTYHNQPGFSKLSKSSVLSRPPQPRVSTANNASAPGSHMGIRRLVVLLSTLGSLGLRPVVKGSVDTASSQTNKVISLAFPNQVEKPDGYQPQTVTSGRDTQEDIPHNKENTEQIAEIDTSQFGIATADGLYAEYLIKKQVDESHRVESHDKVQYVAIDDDDATAVIPTGSSTVDENGWFRAGIQPVKSHKIDIRSPPNEMVSAWVKRTMRFQYRTNDRRLHHQTRTVSRTEISLNMALNR
ncbi:hypothetical protein H9Q72_006899 [Fusarium xylarioides]|uniref:Uncharacterized protein n=1 Tax=Fusarium xylarioides TaxID=221167 RepID=A0A9P7L5F9_9HYPO|nr:hypothetical protein H9Q72_006899 [Fusarium xylarioides]